MSEKTPRVRVIKDAESKKGGVEVEVRDKEIEKTVGETEYRKNEEDKSDIKNNGKRSKLRGLFRSEVGEVKVQVWAYADEAGEIETFSMFELDDPMGLTPHIVEFYFELPTKRQLDSWKSRAMQFELAAQASVMNPVLFRRYLLANLLRRIKMPEGSQEIKIERDPDGKISDETWDIIEDLHPSLLEIAVAKFVQSASLL